MLLFARSRDGLCRSFCVHKPWPPLYSFVTFFLFCFLFRPGKRDPREEREYYIFPPERVQTWAPSYTPTNDHFVVLGFASWFDYISCVKTFFFFFSNYYIEKREGGGWGGCPPSLSFSSVFMSNVFNVCCAGERVMERPSQQYSVSVSCLTV